MKKLALILILFILPSVLALNLKVETTSQDEVIIANVDKQTTFNLVITNLGGNDYMEFYNLASFKMFPIGSTPIKAGESKDIQVKISPLGDIKERGQYTFRYFIRGANKSEVREEISFRIIDLKDAFEIGSNGIDKEAGTAKIFIKNKEKINFDLLDIKFKSVFFDLEEEFSLGPEETKEFTSNVDKVDLNRFSAGVYPLDAEIVYAKEEAELEGTIQFEEHSDLKTTEQESGFVIVTKSIKKTNQGNINAKSVISLEKNIVTSLFTTFSPEPDTSDRDKDNIVYFWEEQLAPGESFEVKVTTNWIVPTLVIILVVMIVIFLNKRLKTDIVLKKKLNFVHTKGGEFALKVSILVNAKRHIEGVNVIDRIPRLVKVHDKFGNEQPLRVDEKRKMVEWTFEKLEPGERRIMSYIIYSKIGVMGKFALPASLVIYERNGKIKEVQSNKAFFIAEEKKRKVDDEDD